MLAARIGFVPSSGALFIVVSLCFGTGFSGRIGADRIVDTWASEDSHPFNSLMLECPPRVGFLIEQTSTLATTTTENGHARRRGGGERRVVRIAF